VAGVGPVPKLAPHEGYFVTRGAIAGRAVLDRRTIHIHDFEAEPDAEFPAAKARLRPLGIRTVLATPLLREGIPIGAFVIRRMEVRPFTEKQIKLLEIFPDQAVIAIENVRLFTELEARTHELTEALEQQTATSEILRVISSSPTDTQPVFDTIARNAARLCEATHSSVNQFDGELLTLAATHGFSVQEIEAGRQMFPRRAMRESAVGRAVLTRTVVHIPDVTQDPEYRFPAQARFYRTILGVPMLREGVPIGAVAIWRQDVRPFSDAQIALVKTFANQAVIAIENVRLFKELEDRNHELTEALEQQTATGEILRVISNSPPALQPVMEAIVENAARVCGALNSSIFRLEGDHLRMVARRGALRRTMAIGDRSRVSRGKVGGRVISDRRTIHVEDILAAEAEFPETVSSIRET